MLLRGRIEFRFLLSRAALILITSVGVAMLWLLAIFWFYGDGVTADHEWRWLTPNSLSIRNHQLFKRANYLRDIVTLGNEGLRFERRFSEYEADSFWVESYVAGPAYWSLKSEHIASWGFSKATPYGFAGLLYVRAGPSNNVFGMMDPSVSVADIQRRAFLVQIPYWLLVTVALSLVSFWPTRAIFRARRLRAARGFGIESLPSHVISA
jgi:hypothetical protein